jgi:hypothetical protein
MYNARNGSRETISARLLHAQANMNSTCLIKLLTTSKATNSLRACEVSPWVALQLGMTARRNCLATTQSAMTTLKQAFHP